MPGPGRLTEASIAAVRDQADIEAVVSDYVTLKRAGHGSLKGLCPFHDEKGASFHVTPGRGFFHCFGCGEGGDTIGFVQKIDNITFVEAVERLAERFNVTLDYEASTGGSWSQEDRDASRHQRARLLEAHKIASAFYRQQLHSQEADVARQFLTDRGFDRAAADQFDLGYSPNTWDTLIRHLGDHGFTPEECVTAGLASEGKNRPIDRFRGRLMWPIRDTSGDIVGFGARKLHDDDNGPKYLNTPETPIYKKSRVLYGLDAARREIAKTRRAVVVEGYTDVMACHLAGVGTAIATCGTAFGEEHIKVLRRLLGDDAAGGEVIFTFDGDAAGQKAALRAFEMDDHFQTHTSVAVEPNGMDPCDLRVARGDEGIHALLASRVPLFEFAIRSTLATHNPSTPEGRVNALTAAAPIIAAMKNPALRPDYIRRLANWLRLDVSTVHDAVVDAANRPATPPPHTATVPTPPESHAQAEVGPARPNPAWYPADRAALKVLVQHPEFVSAALAELRRDDFADDAYRAVWDAITGAAADPARTPGRWTEAVQQHAAHATTRNLVTELTVEPIPARHEPDLGYATWTFLNLARTGCERRKNQIAQALAVVDPASDALLAHLDDNTRNDQRMAEVAARFAAIDASHF